MDVNEDELIGKPLEVAPTQESTGKRCMGKRKQSREGEVVRDDDGNALFAGYCGSWPGKGTDHVGEGRCSNHGGNNGGSREDAGAPEDNTNAVSHGLFAETNRFYQEVMDEQFRKLCDNIYEDYLKDFEERNRPPRTPQKARLFEISVNHIKIIYSDNWAVDKPDNLESGNPMVDKETRIKTSMDMGHATETRYTETVVVGTQQKLRREDRQWLKSYGMLDGPESKQADETGTLAAAIKRVAGSD